MACFVWLMRSGIEGLEDLTGPVSQLVPIRVGSCVLSFLLHRNLEMTNEMKCGSSIKKNISSVDFISGLVAIIKKNYIGMITF